MPSKAKKPKVIEEAPDPLTADLNDAQRAAVTFGTGPLLIVAGAGTGKTSVISRRVAHLIASGVQPDEILALTFTDKAAGEMVSRVEDNLGYGYYDLWISTFHAFCERILKQHALDIGLPNDFRTLETAQQKILIRQNLDRFAMDYYKPLGNPTRFISALVAHFSTAKDEEVSPEQYISYANSLKPMGSVPIQGADPKIDEQEISRIQEVANAYKVYQGLLLEHAALDFGDLINAALHLFRSRPRILNYYRSKFKYVLVDEFQDTNHAQYELVKLLAAPANNLTVVGDDDQSIYKFRGASISNILQFKEDYPAAREITLIENYRSGQAILDASYDAIQLNNPQRLESILNISKRMRSNIPERGSVAVLAAQTVSGEVDAVIAKIVEVRKATGAPWNDFAILVRANSHAEPFTAKLSSLGLPYLYFANKGLYRKPIIVDILQYIRVLLDSNDNGALYRVLSRDPFCLDHADLMALSHYAHKRTVSLFEAMSMAAEIPGITKAGAKIAERVTKLLNEHGPLIRERTAGESFVTIIKDLGIANRVEPETVENAENRELIDQFYRKIEGFESDSEDKSMRNFMELLDFEQEAGEEGKLEIDPQSGPESITIMTIHASKGLEFTYVFVVNMIQGRFPSRDRRDPIELPDALIRESVPTTDANLQEERRLLYVAMTRAKFGLYFSYAADMGGVRTAKPSQFLVDLNLIAAPEKSAVITRNGLGDSASSARNRAYDVEKHLPDTFSFTQLSDFENCPLRFKYRHWLKLPLKGSQYLSFGNTIHKTLELFLSAYQAEANSSQGDLFNPGKIPTFATLSGLYERNWVDEWYRDKKQKEEYRESGRKAIASFYEQFSKHPVVPKYIEKSFRLPLGPYFFTGKIDRADPGENGLSIVDYKTGKEKDLDSDGKDQLLIYQWAAQEYMKEKVASLCYWYLLEDKFSETFLGSQEEIDALKEKMLVTIEKIRHALIHDTFKELDKKAPQHKCEYQDLE